MSTEAVISGARRWHVEHGDALAVLRVLPDGCVQTVVTSPPYWGLRDYGVPGQIGLEETPQEFIEKLVDVFRETRRVLRNDGTLWLNLGDSYAGSGPGPEGESGLIGARHNQAATRASCAARGDAGRRLPPHLKRKDLVGMPWSVAFALRSDGWYLRSDIIWHKPNPMPSSVRDRPTGAHEYLFLLAKSERYYYDAAAIAEDATSEPKKATDMRRGSTAMRGQAAIRPRGKNEESSDRRRAGFNDRWDTAEDAGDVPPTRNRRSVWTIASRPFRGAHFATFPQQLVEPCILAGSRIGDHVNGDEDNAHDIIVAPLADAEIAAIEYANIMHREDPAWEQAMICVRDSDGNLTMFIVTVEAVPYFHAHPIICSDEARPAPTKGEP